jgi:hypothetical protein
VFDHSSPTYSQTDARIVTTGGLEAHKNCPVTAPPGIPPPLGGVCDAGYGIYWSYGLGGWLAYNGHDGTDYGISYRPLYAAADSDRVMYAGWWDPQNHTTALGIYVKLHHPNGYISSYGHMSAIAVQACSTIGCSNIAHGEVLGISGNTGNSTGPHLHFQVTSPAGVSVDPYGWKGNGTDPWPYNQAESLWVMYPRLISYGAQALPSGGETLDYPPLPATGILIDDSGANFSQEPEGCWNHIAVSTGQAQNGNMSYVKPRVGAPNCIGRWAFPQGSTPGLYAVYVRIPAVHATTEGAVYAVTHGGQTSRVVISQAVFPNGFYASDGWVYAGKYGFDGTSREYVELGNGTHDSSAVVGNLELGADAVRYVYLGASTPTPIPITFTATHTPLPSQTPTVTPTSPASETPPSRTPTVTKTPTASRTPTITRTPSRTPTSTHTRRPTATPPYTKLRVYFVNTVSLRTGTPPFEVAGYRWANSSAIFPEAVLNEYFKGPGHTERYVYRWTAVTSGFTGYERLEVGDGVARVYLRGACAAETSGYTIAQPLMANLKQFSQIQAVKIYDQYGETQHPDGATDSVPLCLDPSFVPTRTPTAPASHTPTATATRPRTPTPTVRPTATPLYRLLNVYFYDRSLALATGKRWAVSSANLPRFVVDQYFKGPGYVEQYIYRWTAPRSGTTGYSALDVSDGIARLYLTGACNSQGSTFTIAAPLIRSLKQFSEIQYVKIYDQNGETEIPDGAQDSIPACLEP